MGMLIFYAVLAIGVSFLCSMLEAGLLSLPRSHVETLVASGSPLGAGLKKMKSDIDRPLAAILTLNTIAHTVGAAGVGAQSAVVFGSATVGVASAIMTFAILVFSEIIPKTLGAVHAKRLAKVTFVLTTGMIWLCYPLILLLEGVNRLIGYERRADSISRMEILATIQLGGSGGALAKRETRIVRNLLALEEVTIEKVMTPRTVVFGLPASLTVDAALAEHGPIRFARIPVYRDMLDHVEGYVARFDLHAALADGKGQATLGELARPIKFLPEQADVAKAMQVMLDNHEHIAAVVDEFGGLAGIVTLEDVMETLLGQEIVDETDPAPDMQDVARRQSPQLQQPD